MPRLSDLDEHERAAFSRVWGTLAAVAREGGCQHAGLTENPARVWHHADVGISFGFAGGTVIGATVYGVLVLAHGVAFSYAADGHLRYARLAEPAAGLPTEHLYRLAQLRAPAARWC